MATNTSDLTRAYIRAATIFARRRPWLGTFDQRYDKFSEALTALCAVEPEWKTYQMVHVGKKVGTSIRSNINRRLLRITMTGRLSVVTLLSLFARTRGMTGGDAQCWAIQLFAQAFPKSFDRCSLNAASGMLLNETHDDE